MTDLADSIDRAVIQSRLNTVAVIMMVDRSDRLEYITAVLEQLNPGAYLIGTGPSTVGIIPLTVDEVVSVTHCSAFSIDTATCRASTFDPSGEKWTLFGSWIFGNCGWAKAYRSSMTMPCSSMIFLAAAL